MNIKCIGVFLTLALVSKIYAKDNRSGVRAIDGNDDKEFKRVVEQRERVRKVFEEEKKNLDLEFEEAKSKGWYRKMKNVAKASARLNEEETGILEGLETDKVFEDEEDEETGVVTKETLHRGVQELQNKVPKIARLRHLGRCYPILRNQKIDEIVNPSSITHFDFGFKPTDEVSNKWSSILRLTSTTNNCCGYGDRWLGFWFKPRTHLLAVTVGTKGTTKGKFSDGNQHLNKIEGIKPYDMNHIEVYFCGDEMKLKINGDWYKKTLSIKNRPEVGKVNVYAGDAFYPAAKGEFCFYDYSDWMGKCEGV